jgi:hypothetical protein
MLEKGELIRCRSVQVLLWCALVRPRLVWSVRLTSVNGTGGGIRTGTLFLVGPSSPAEEVSALLSGERLKLRGTKRTVTRSGGLSATAAAYAGAWLAF